MDWKERMTKGMEIIEKACHDAVFCCDCPFSKYCDILASSNDIYNEWIFKENEDD